MTPEERVAYQVKAKEELREAQSIRSKSIIAANDTCRAAIKAAHETYALARQEYLKKCSE
jgi:hypothetical protein